MATIITLTPDELRQLLDHHERELAGKVNPDTMITCLEGACSALSQAATPQVGR